MDLSKEKSCFIFLQNKTGKLFKTGLRFSFKLVPWAGTGAVVETLYFLYFINFFFLGGHYLILPELKNIKSITYNI